MVQSDGLLLIQIKQNSNKIYPEGEKTEQLSGWAGQGRAGYMQ